MENDQQMDYDDIDTSSYDIENNEGSSSPIEGPSEATQPNLNEESDYDYEIEIDGEVYDADAILQWKLDADNKSSWQASNTQKAQSISQLGKLFETMQSDPKLRDYVKDYYYDNPDGLKQAGLADIDWNTIPEDLNPDDYLVEDDPHNQLMQRVEHLETEKNIQVLEGQLENLENSYPDLLGGERTDAFLQFVDESGLGDLELGFRLWATDSLMEQRTQNRALDENRARNNGVVIGTHDQGASQVVSHKPGTPTEWNNVDLSDPEISKYFDN